jgi:hypothetical protein
MKITIPENIKEINLLQYQRYHELMAREDISEHDRNIRKIQIFTGLKPDQVKLISSNDYAEILALIDIALNKEHNFEPTFKIEDVEFGFIPNLDKITAGEFIDIEKYQGNVEDLNKLMAVLFRPIKKRDVFNNYSIESYSGTEQFSEVMKLMPLSAVNGSLVFFSSLSNELLSYTQRFMNQEAEREKKQASTSKSGDGMQPLTN